MRLPQTSVEITDSVGPPKPFNEDEFNDKVASVKRALDPLKPHQRQRVIAKLERQFTSELNRLETSREEKRRQLEAMEALQEWIKSAPALVLEKNDCTRLHRLKEAGVHSRIIGGDGEALEKSEALRHVEHTFVVRHNWAEAFKGAEGIEDGVKFPYDICAFEFRIAGRNIIACGAETPTEQKFTAFIEAGDYWYSYGGMDSTEDPVVMFLWAQMRAICIALDAEVATHTVVRAPCKLNEKREREGKTPLADFHVVDLARRHRISNPLVGHGGGKKRLHFRRGHWRHFETTKTWVRWCLVGNPDLGFIQKHYTL